MVTVLILLRKQTAKKHCCVCFFFFNFIFKNMNDLVSIKLHRCITLTKVEK